MLQTENIRIFAYIQDGSERSMSKCVVVVSVNVTIMRILRSSRVRRLKHVIPVFFS